MEHPVQVTFRGLEPTDALKKAVEEYLDSIITYYQKQIDQHNWYGFWDYGDVMHSYDQARHECGIAEDDRQRHRIRPAHPCPPPGGVRPLTHSHGLPHGSSMAEAAGPACGNRRPPS